MMTAIFESEGGAYFIFPNYHQIVRENRAVDG